MRGLRKLNFGMHICHLILTQLEGMCKKKGAFILWAFIWSWLPGPTLVQRVIVHVFGFLYRHVYSASSFKCYKSNIIGTLDHHVTGITPEVSYASSDIIFVWGMLNFAGLDP